MPTKTQKAPATRTLFRHGEAAMNDTTLAQHLCTRLCHDLAGPIGAINNGAEFLAEENDGMFKDAIDLISGSAAEAVARLQFFRQAYGKLNEFGEADLQEKKKLTEALFAKTRIVIDWPEQHTGITGISISQKMGQLLLNMIIAATRSLPKGGTISVRVGQEEDGQRRMSVTATSEAIRDEEDVTRILIGVMDAPITPQTAQAVLTMQLAHEMRVSLTVEKEETTYRLIACRTIG